MRNKKWLTYTAGILLTLIALAAVGLAGFRVGMMQNVTLLRMDHTNRPAFDQNVDPKTQGVNPADNNPVNPNDRNPRGFDRGHRGMPMFGGLFGLIHIAILALLLWFGYKFVQKSGWKLVRVQNETPAVRETVVAESNEKESE